MVKARSHKARSHKARSHKARSHKARSHKARSHKARKEKKGSRKTSYLYISKHSISTNVDKLDKNYEKGKVALKELEKKGLAAKGKLSKLYAKSSKYIKDIKQDIKEGVKELKNSQ